MGDTMQNINMTTYIEKLKYLNSKNIPVKVKGHTLNHLPMNETRKILETCGETLGSFSKTLEGKVRTTLFLEQHLDSLLSFSP